MSAEYFEVEVDYHADRSHSADDERAINYSDIGHVQWIATVEPMPGSKVAASSPRISDAPSELMINDDGVGRGERQRSMSIIGHGTAKLMEICVAASIHTAVWVVLLVWIDLFYASHIFSEKSIWSTVFAFVFIWMSTFMCFYALVEDDDRYDS